ncbi:hypothetical protein CAPTEDRAFT_221119 [Capitella teleta]|uniref:PR domain zinc finger protein 10 n=1 Tax=Capitella teleta TaxID=283909 RepID=R7U217_CAPTE|nr:hypothetical protein CAPTEDRAFT_221119 [Capitella teleta]|eukprot:ELU00380.1 hypothetical protein CAPTEDRAFT_221119 [Capitella teleta]
MLMGQQTTSMTSTVMSSATTPDPQLTAPKEDSLSSYVPMMQMAKNEHNMSQTVLTAGLTDAEAHSLLTNGQDRHVADLNFAMETNANASFDNTHKAQTAAPFHSTNMDLVVQDEDLDVESIANQANSHNEIDIVSFQSAHANQLQTQITTETNSDAENKDLITQLHDQLNVRKSQRLAEQEKIETFVRPRYESRPYSVHDIWCEDCQISHQYDCVEHKLKAVYDRVVLSRAWASLPSHLQIFRLGEASSTELGVFAKKAFPKRIQFGPFVAEHVLNRDQLTNPKFFLQVEQEDGQVAYLEASDENKCNWMMFVRPAVTYEEQNLVAYQYGNGIFFTTIKPIEPRQELKVWYAASYAEHIGVSVHELTDEDLLALGEEALKWPCYECPKKFRTSVQLQKHLAVHEMAQDGEGDAHEASSADESARPTRMAKKKLARLRQRAAKRRGRPFKNKKDGTGSSEETPVFQSWKKKKTNMYLNKYDYKIPSTLLYYSITFYRRMKKYREPIKRSIKTLYKRSAKDSGGNEWVCTHCDLTFDNPSLLNLHTLTHAAEDVGMDERKLTGPLDGVEVDGNYTTETDINDVLKSDACSAILLSLEQPSLDCPVCNKQFQQKQDLIQHASEHATLRKGGRPFNPQRPYACSKCSKAFGTEDRLAKHLLSHTDDDQKPLKCPVCRRGFMNNSALSCHLKTHSNEKFYSCPLCKEGFGQIHAMREHTVTHAVNGVYECPECHKATSEFNEIRRHMRSCHSLKQYPCSQCAKIFTRPDKLKLHLLKHSNHREFMCETCGKQFKRKDKLKEHNMRLHGPNAKKVATEPGQQPAAPAPKFHATVSPNDYERFIYKCHLCLLGFKRRGMLVNHLANRHPDIKTDSVPELNLPILKAQRDFFCQYCDKVYKSSSKRKQHILKIHPGADLPPSSRQKAAAAAEAVSNFQPSTFSQTIGSVTTMPHSCSYCHKQYASRAKLLQHIRRKHNELAEDDPGIQAVILEGETDLEKMDKTRITYTYIPGSTVDVTPIVTVSSSGPTDVLHTTDLLTQAMSELTQTLDYRQQIATVVTPQTAGEIQLSNGQRISTLVAAATGNTVEFSQEQPQYTQLQAQSPSNEQPLSPNSATNQLQMLPPGSQIVIHQEGGGSVIRF